MSLTWKVVARKEEDIKQKSECNHLDQEVLPNYGNKDQLTLHSWMYSMGLSSVYVATQWSLVRCGSIS